MFTAPYDAYYVIIAGMDFIATATDQYFSVGIYKGGTLLTQAERYAHSSSAQPFGAEVTRIVWLAAGNLIDMRANTSANLTVRNATLNIHILGW